MLISTSIAKRFRAGWPEKVSPVDNLKVALGVEEVLDMGLACANHDHHENPRSALK